jgi:hypothetical protein
MPQGKDEVKDASEMPVMDLQPKKDETFHLRDEFSWRD